MDSTPLHTAYVTLLDAAEHVASVDAHTNLPPGEWDADQQLAHLIAVDAGILSVICAVAAGALATFDNRLSLDTYNLARISTRGGGQTQMRERVRAQGQAMCAMVEQLSGGELDQPVPTLLMSGDVLLVDQPLRLRDLLAGIAEDHLPRHTQQLLALAPAGAPAAV